MRAARANNSPLTSGRGGSGASAPKPAITAGDELQSILVARPARVFRQLEIFFRRFPALALLPHFLHFRRGVLHQREDVLRILLGAESSVGQARMTRD